MHTPTPPPAHQPNLDVLRALAVMGVMAHHTQSLGGFDLPFFGEAGGWFGVQLFFLISGYLITDSASRYPLRTYALHRFFRIFPAYWLAYLGIGWLTGSLSIGRGGAWPLMLNLLNLQQLSPRALIEHDVLHVSWTLTVELLWYVLAPLLALGGRRLALPALALATLVSAGWSLAASLDLLGPWYASGLAALGRPAEIGQTAILINNAFPAQLVYFMLGACCFHYREPLSRTPAVLLTLGMVGGLLMWKTYFYRIPSPNAFTGLGVLALLIAVLRAPASGDGLLARIGTVSYSIYLIHFPVLLWAKQHLMVYSEGVATAAAYLATFVLANAMYEGVEKPGMRLGRWLARRAGA